MPIVKDSYVGAHIINLIKNIMTNQRPIDDGLVTVEQVEAGIARLEIVGDEGIPTDMLIKHLKKHSDSRGHISKTPLRGWLRWYASGPQVSDITAFGVFDEMFQNPNLSPSDQRPESDDNPGAKHVTEVKTEDIAGLL